MYILYILLKCIDPSKGRSLDSKKQAEKECYCGTCKSTALFSIPCLWSDLTWKYEAWELLSQSCLVEASFDREKTTFLL